MLFTKYLHKLHYLLALPIIVLIRAYQLLISPFLGKRCRFHPTCSQYGIHALKAHGLIIGGWLLLKRLVKCHPFHSGGVDLVPPTKD